jgi:hypothetical protein
LLRCVAVGRVETELRRDEAGAAFVVRTEERIFQHALRELAYAPADEEFIRRVPPTAPDLDATFARFERHVEELLEQTARLRRVPWQDALGETARRLEHAGVEWFLSGSAALAARGIAVEPRDLDLVTTDDRRTAAALADVHIEPPVEDEDRGWIAAWFGRAFVGARVEWVAGVDPDVDVWPGPSEIGPAAAARLEPIDWNGRTLFLSPLDLQLAVCEQRGLDDRGEAIRAYERSLV